jgi:hypothetical protein
VHVDDEWTDRPRRILSVRAGPGEGCGQEDENWKHQMPHVRTAIVPLRADKEAGFR